MDCRAPLYSPFAKAVLAALNGAGRGYQPGFGMPFRPELIKWPLCLRVLVRISDPRRPFQTGTVADTVFVKGVVRCLSGGVSDFAVAGVALGVEADVADRRPVSDLA